MLQTRALLPLLGFVLLVGCTKPSKEASPPPEVPKKAEAGQTAKDSTKKPEETLPAAPSTKALPEKKIDKGQLQEWVQEATERGKCNRVMGCAVEEKIVGAGVDVVPIIIEAYRAMHRPVYQKFHLITMLGQIASRQAEAFLIGELDSPLWQSRAQSAIALGRIGSQSIKSKLGSMFDATTGQNRLGSRYALAYALVRLGEPEYADVLVEALDPKIASEVNWGFTAIAVELAGELSLRRACKYLDWSIKHPDLFLKKAALEAAGRLRCENREVQEAASDLLAHRVGSVREVAGEALEKMTGMRFNTKEAWLNYRNARDAK